MYTYYKEEVRLMFTVLYRFLRIFISCTDEFKICTENYDFQYNQ